MPRPGFKSITVSDDVYDSFFDAYQRNKEEYSMKGVNSFSGYITYQLKQVMQKDKTFAKYSPKIEKISVDSDRIILKDNTVNRIVEILIIQNELMCQICNNTKCIHVGFCYDLPEVYEIIGGSEKE